MRVLLATDAFPPGCGGSGWSTYELAKGLRAHGHEVAVVRPRTTRGSVASSQAYDGFTPIEYHAAAPNVPFIRNYFKNERLYRRFGHYLATLVRMRAIDIVHAQHVLTGPASITAGREANVPVVCTVRDYWPVCYWSDLIYDRSSDRLCPACSPTMMTRCVRPRAGGLWPLAVPLIPYMRANLSLKRQSLASADAVVAVSSTIAQDLRERASELDGTRLETIPNPVDTAGIRDQAGRQERPMALPYAIFVGKLEPNKGVARLITAIERADLDWPLVIVGDGSERGRLEAASGRAGRDVRFVGWLPREEVLGWLRYAAVLVFPSYGPESLSRVLLEASALARPIAANDTGGTGDIITNEVTGLLSHTAEGLGDDLARLRRDDGLRLRLGAAARQRVEERFDASGVVRRIEALYANLVERGRREAGVR
ncbi:MAG TPA: glycosyltransferase family 4 protein [Vicinamibacterales bacterium]|jgi:glycosyltransferase involved in cell wall biosynthesis|nr:glycosyltransferase family 4 protein [Vicinamibacterales bacterium]HJN45502.1 glycosyltransferase family 4 protein [Vicinamibacterales bacterium]